LREYSAYVEFWDDGAGDTHELLGSREILSARSGELSAAQIDAMAATDDVVVRLVSDLPATRSWDSVMLNKVADVIRADRNAMRKAA
jgi:hypothetical protein